MRFSTLGAAALLAAAFAHAGTVTGTMDSRLDLSGLPTGIAFSFVTPNPFWMTSTTFALPNSASASASAPSDPSGTTHWIDLSVMAQGLTGPASASALADSQTVQLTNTTDVPLLVTLDMVNDYLFQVPNKNGPDTETYSLELLDVTGGGNTVLIQDSAALGTGVWAALSCGDCQPTAQVTIGALSSEDFEIVGSINTNAVASAPEPSTWTLIAAGCALLAAGKMGRNVETILCSAGDVRRDGEKIQRHV